MTEPSDDEWHLVRATEYFQPAAVVRDRKQILEWERAPGHWSGSGKHTKLNDIKGKLHADAVLGHGATGLVERVTFQSVTMARKKIRVRGMHMEQLREEANIMEKLAHRHIVELVGSYTHGQRDLYILIYPAATCNLQCFLDDIEEVRSGTSSDITDASKRFEALGFKNIGLTQVSPGDLGSKSLERPLKFLASILGCVAEAVTFVHANNIRHQDLKPRNILLNPGQVYLADFGISRDLKDATHSLTEGFPGGTPHYLAPEVTQGERHHMSPADIYSLGCVFLTVASVLYVAPHGQYEAALSEQDLCKKTAAIGEFVGDLRKRAWRLGKAAHDASTCAPKHLLGLIELMLSDDPKARPTACQASKTLHELGGLDQVYHGKCCKRDTFYVTQLIDDKIKLAGEGKIDQAKKIQQLEAQHDMDMQKIEQLLKSQETYKSLAESYQSLVEKERKHVTEQYEKVLLRRSKELEVANAARKSLETEIAQLRRQRQPQRNDKKGRFPQMNGHADTPHQSHGGPRRSSRVPLPVRPSTPLRPTYPRESTSGSNDSTFSRTTAASSVSFGSHRSPPSEISTSPNESVTLPTQPLDSSRNGEEESSSNPVARPAISSIRTWAEITAKLAMEQNKNMPMQNGTMAKPTSIKISPLLRSHATIR